MKAIQYNEGYYMDGTRWSIPLTEVRLNHEWTRGEVTLYMAIEENNTPYFVEVKELGNDQREVFVTGSRIQQTSLPLNEFLRKFKSLKVI